MPLFFVPIEELDSNYDAVITPMTMFSIPTREVRKIQNGEIVSLIDGKKKEKRLLQYSYKACLNLAAKSIYENVGIRFDCFNMPYLTESESFKIVEKTIVDFLRTHDLNIFLIIFEHISIIEFDSKIYNQILRLIVAAEDERGRKGSCQPIPWCDFPVQECRCEIAYEKPCKSLYDKSLDEKCLYKSEFCSENIEAVEEMVNSIEDNFVVSLLKLIDSKDMTDVECYKKANVSKQTWYKILNKKDYRPSKNTVIAFAVSLGLNYSETQHLLSTAGFALSNSSKFDIIIQYFINNKIYDIFKINEMLFRFGEPCLGLQ